MSPSKNLLAVDLGGTKTLMGIYDSRNNAPENIHKRRYLSAEWPSFEAMLGDYLDNLPSSIDYPTKGCISVAGRVSQGSSKLTNLDWDLNQLKIQKCANLDHLELINDFCVLVYSLPYIKTHQFTQINGKESATFNQGFVSIIGAGTGLGIARGLITSKNIYAFPSEGGHREFSPRSENEWQLYKWIKKDLKINRVSIERIVSGTGLGHIANWLLHRSNAIDHPLYHVARSWRQKKSNQHDLPAIVSKSAEEGDPLMNEALDMWLNAYGSVAGDIVLQELCDTGLWIAGGTAKKQLKRIRSNTFLKPMCDKGRFTNYVEQIPVHVLIDPDIGLFASACRALMLA